MQGLQPAGESGEGALHETAAPGKQMGDFLEEEEEWHQGGVRDSEKSLCKLY